MTRSFKIVINQRAYTIEIEDLAQRPVRVKVDGELYQVEWEGTPQAMPVSQVNPEIPPRPSTTPPQPNPGPALAEERNVIAPMPGKVLGIKCQVGDRVERGDVVCVVESMKMETEIPAPSAGVVKAIRVSVGEMVGHGSVLVALG